MLRVRIITAIFASLALLAVILLLPPLLARAVLAILLLIGAWEWSGFLGAWRMERYAFVALIAAIIVSAFLWIGALSDHETVFQVALAWWVFAFSWTFFYPTPIAKPVAWFCGVLVLVPAYIALDWLYQAGAGILLFMLSIVVVADIGAYFSGKAFGRVKLAAQISPGKTWEGAIGGLVAVILLIAVLSRWFEFPLATVLPLGIAVAIISVVGDLTVSMFKRTAGVKDSGTLFPGHGGFLDRADSIMAAAPVFSLGIIWLDPVVLGMGA